VKPKNQVPQDNLKIFGTKPEGPISNHRGTCEGGRHDEERWDLQTHEVDVYTPLPLSDHEERHCGRRVDEWTNAWRRPTQE
jgi:hypothetical protein